MKFIRTLVILTIVAMAACGGGGGGGGSSLNAGNSFFGPATLAGTFSYNRDGSQNNPVSDLYGAVQPHRCARVWLEGRCVPGPDRAVVARRAGPGWRGIPARESDPPGRFAAPISGENHAGPTFNP